MAVPDALSQPVALDLFEGPFDLLLTLVLREEVDLLELPLVEVVRAALGEGARERWDTNTAGELIVLLAAMAELKAKVLLGEEVDEEPDPDALEARELLAARLVAYAPFQRAARWLHEQAAASVGPRYRRVPLGGAGPVPPRVEDPALLQSAMAALLVAVPEPSLDHINTRRVSIPDVLDRLQRALRRVRDVSFDELVRGAGRLEEAVTFMAMLELARRGEATLAQPVPFGDIAITGVR
ncbi:MAG: segregation and condensation protein A [Thermoleophilia bacterium]|jgi:segregation and condensation protein A